MKKNIIIFFIIFSFQATIHLKAQHRYLADSPTWIVSSSCYPGNCNWKSSNIYFYLKGDTIIGNYNYHKLFKKEFGYIMCYSGNIYFGSKDTINPYTYLRDTLKQIRFWDGSADKLLYDFDLNLGDTVPNSVYGFTTVDSIDSIPVSNYFRKRFKLSNPDCTNYLYEGIGNFNGFLEPVVCINVSEGCNYTLTCYGFNDTAWYPTVDALYPCIIPPIPLGIEEHKQPIPSSEISIYPNPVTSTFLISAVECKIEKIKITNVLGGQLFQIDSLNSKSEIDISSFLKGIYIVEVHSEKFVLRKKIIKE